MMNQLLALSIADLSCLELLNIQDNSADVIQGGVYIPSKHPIDDLVAPPFSLEHFNPVFRPHYSTTPIFSPEILRLAQGTGKGSKSK